VCVCVCAVVSLDVNVCFHVSLYENM
jgi:hypothetical protein